LKHKKAKSYRKASESMPTEHYKSHFCKLIWQNVKTLKQQALEILALPSAVLVPKQLKELLIAMVDTIERQQHQIDTLKARG
jgi:hypothetical protein